MIQKLFALGALGTVILAWNEDNESSEGKLIDLCQSFAPSRNISTNFLLDYSYKPDRSLWQQSTSAFPPDYIKRDYTRFFYSSPKQELGYSKIANGKWTEPKKVSFATTSYDNDAQFLGSNNTPFFTLKDLKIVCI